MILNENNKLESVKVIVLKSESTRLILGLIISNIFFFSFLNDIHIIVLVHKLSNTANSKKGCSGFDNKLHLVMRLYF